MVFLFSVIYCKLFDKSFRVNCSSPGGVYHEGENEQNASFENFPSLVTYGYELREEEWGSTQTPVGPITLLFNAIIVIPSISVTSRRLQDVSTSGWLQLSYFFIIGIFVVTILCILPPKDDENKWGRNPLLG